MRLGRIAMAAVLLSTGLWFTGGPGAAAPPTSTPQQGNGFGTPTEAISGYGDFTEVGNGSLRCPVQGERVSLFAGAQTCRDATQREPLYQLPLFGWGSNNGYYMQLAGAGATNGPGGSTLFDESSASVQIPAGTSVLYAQLDWGGDTGGYQGAAASRCESPPYWLEPASAPPPAPATASPQDQPVTIAVGADPAATVPLNQQNYTSSESSSTPVGMYSDWADVTNDFQDLAAGEQSTVSVGDVWAPTGYGCAAGWSLTLVFGATTAIPGYQTLREFDVYAGHLRTTDRSQLAVPLPEPDIDPADAAVKLGVTAYDGDWNNASDSLLVDGTAQPDPCGTNNSTGNFFTSCANGALDPLSPGQSIPNNFSVDAKTITPTVTTGTAQPGDIDIALNTGYDVYLLQGLVVAENIDPSFTINSPPAFSKPNLHVGDIVQFTVTGSNTGNIPLSGMVLSDQVSSDCGNKPIGNLAPGQSYSVTCTMSIPNATTLSDAITVTARWPGDAAGLTASDQVTFTQQVLGPQLTISQSASSNAISSGAPVTVTFTVTNTGEANDGALSDIEIAEPHLTGCLPQSIPSLAPGTTATLTCTVKPTATVTATATATATNDTNVKLTATSNLITVAVSGAQFTITNTTKPSSVSSGGTTRFTVTVHNSGTVAITLRVSNDNAPGCDFSVQGTGLAGGASRSEECTVTLPQVQKATKFTDTASISATPILPDGTSGAAIAGSAQGVVTIEPSSSSASAGTATAAHAQLDGAAASGGSSAKTGGSTAAGQRGTSLASYTGIEVSALAAACALMVATALLLARTRRRARNR
jgi:uncharacterized repeat protein (TIGR01451 family)